MNSDEKIEILKAREYTVAKSNQIVQKSRYDFNVQEQRTIAYTCSMIKPIETADKIKGVPYQLEYEFDILDYARICDIQTDGRMYSTVKKTLKDVADKSMWLTLPDGSETIVRWFSRVTADKRNGKVKIKLDELMIPYLVDLKSKFLSYGLKNILNMKSQYSIRLYELMKSYHDMKVAQTDHRSLDEKLKNPQKTYWTIDLDELKKQLMVDTVKSYSNFKDFRIYVLEKAQKEINELTDITVYFEPITKGRKTVKVKFTIVDKVGIEKIIAEKTNEEKFREL